MVWGRRRVGKTALLQRFVDDKPVVFHAAPIGGRSTSYACCSSRWPSHSLRACADPAQRPYATWDDALDDLAARASDTPTLLVLDEFSELVRSSRPCPARCVPFWTAPAATRSRACSFADRRCATCRPTRRSANRSTVASI